ncbi:MAG: hypothetical protein LBG52_05685 [Candidatus Peribacteria bacterium]|nr:hypothetical protein [Candidatus Peribacteria bacterium]
MIKNKNIPNEDQWITWRNSLNLILIKDIDTAIQKFPSEERKEIISKGKELKRSLKEGRKNFTDNEKVLLDFYEMFEIYEAIQISEIMDKLEASVNGFLETIPTKNLNQENIEYSLFA